MPFGACITQARGPVEMILGTVKVMMEKTKSRSAFFHADIR